jgi:hypothetical protein
MQRSLLVPRRSAPSADDSETLPAEKGGETLYLYLGQRTRQCERLSDATCEAVMPVEIHANRAVDLGRRPLSEEGREALTRAKGQS